MERILGNTSVILVCAGMALTGGWPADSVDSAPHTIRTRTTDCSRFDFDSFDTAPRLESAKSARYPFMAVTSGIKGDVVVSVQVLADGAACDAHVVDGTHPLIDREAVIAALAGSYSPATLHGVCVPGSIDICYTFDWKFSSVDDPDHEISSVFGSPPYVRDLAQPLTAAASGEQEAPVYVRDGVQFQGDLSVELYRSIVELMQEYLHDDETPHVVASLFIASPDARGGLEYRPEITIKTCTARYDDGKCEKGRFFRFVWGGEAFELESNSWSWID